MPNRPTMMAPRMSRGDNISNNGQKGDDARTDESSVDAPYSSETCKILFLGCYLENYQKCLIPQVKLLLKVVLILFFQYCLVLNNLFICKNQAPFHLYGGLLLIRPWET